MAIFSVTGGTDRRSMIDRHMKKSKEAAISSLVDDIHCVWRREENLQKLLKRAYLLLPEGTEPTLLKNIEQTLELEPGPQPSELAELRAAMPHLLLRNLRTKLVKLGKAKSDTPFTEVVGTITDLIEG